MKNHTLAVGARARMNERGLTDTEKKIAQWIFKKENLDEKTTAKSIAEIHNVSTALIVKICRKLGYSGFKEAKLDILTYLDDIPTHLDDDFSSDEDAEKIISKVFNLSIQTLKEGWAISDGCLNEKAAQIIIKARHIDLYGVGGSQSVCADFQHKLLRIGIRSATYTGDRNMMSMSASLLSGKDVVIAVSQSGVTRDVLDSLAIAKSNGVKIISITNSLLSPIAEISDISLGSPARDTPILGQNASARILQLTLLDSLFVEIAKQNIKQAEANLNKTRNAVKTYR